MRLVAITSTHAFGDRVLGRLATAGIRLDTLIVALQHGAPARPGSGFAARGRQVWARVRSHWQAWQRWRHIASRIIVVDSILEANLERILAATHPDVLVLAGTGIIPPNLLAIPSIATLNAHPGLLPWVRGVCPLERALLRGVALGVTVHAVDAGIDTGPIIRRVLLPVDDGEKDRISLSRRLEDKAIDLLRDVTQDIVLGKPLESHPQSSRHPYGRWVSDAERARAVDLLAKGEAARLYRQWRAAAGGDVLPDHDRWLNARAGSGEV